MTMPALVASMEDIAALSSRIAALEALSADWDSACDFDTSDPGRLKPFVWHRNSGNNSERIAALPISGVPTPSYWTVYSVQLPTIFAGDLIEAFATFEVTNDTNVNVMVCRALRLCDSASATTGVEISEEACRNVTPAMHHDCVQDFGSIIGTAAMSGKYVNFVACANVYGPPRSITVEQDYGRLTCTITRAAVLESHQ